MALDTKARRYAAIHVMSPWRGLSVVPSGSIDAPARLAVSWLYAGIAASAEVAALVFHRRRRRGYR